MKIYWKLAVSRVDKTFFVGPRVQANRYYARVIPVITYAFIVKKKKLFYFKFSVWKAIS